MHFPPKFGEENGGASYSPNVAYLAHWVGVGGGAGPQEAGAGPHFLLQIFFSYFPPLKPRCILWSGVSYSPKNTVYIHMLTVALFTIAKIRKQPKCPSIVEWIKW